MTTGRINQVTFLSFSLLSCKNLHEKKSNFLGLFMGKKTPSQSLENAVRGPTKQSNTEQFWDTFQLLDVFMGKSVFFDTKSLSQPLKESLALFTHSTHYSNQCRWPYKTSPCTPFTVCYDSPYSDRVYFMSTEYIVFALVILGLTPHISPTLVCPHPHSERGPTRAPFLPWFILRNWGFFPTLTTRAIFALVYTWPPHLAPHLAPHLGPPPPT